MKLTSDERSNTELVYHVRDIDEAAGTLRSYTDL